VIQAFGTDPSPRLDALHIQILGDSPDLTGPLWPGAFAGTMVGPDGSLSCVMRRGDRVRHIPP
jgi:hypothetical protein